MKLPKDNYYPFLNTRPPAGNPLTLVTILCWNGTDTSSTLKGQAEPESTRSQGRVPGFRVLYSQKQKLEQSLYRGSRDWVEMPGKLGPGCSRVLLSISGIRSPGSKGKTKDWQGRTLLRPRVQAQCVVQIAGWGAQTLESSSREGEGPFAS